MTSTSPKKVKAVYEKSLGEVIELIAEAKARIAQLNVEITRLQALEISLHNAIRMTEGREHGSL